MAYDDFKTGVTLDQLRPYLREEISNVWRLWKAGIVRENFVRTDVGGVVIVFESADLAEAKPPPSGQQCPPHRQQRMVPLQRGRHRASDSCIARHARNDCGHRAARAAGMRVASTRHMSPPAPWLGASQLRTAMAWQRVSTPEAVVPWLARGAPASQIEPSLAPRDDELVVDKLAMSAFEGTPMVMALRDCGLVGVFLVGIALEIGIEPTVHHATDLGLVPIVLADASGHGQAEAGSRALETMRFVGEAVIGHVDSFSRALGRPGG